MNVVAACLIAVAALSTAASSPAQAAPRYAAMVVDGHTGKILYSRKGDGLRFPASLTKIMTLYLLFDHMEAGKLHAGSLLTVTRNAAKQQPSKLGLKAGKKIRVSDAIRALVTKSANDVAVTIAEDIGGTEKNFAKLMTAKARKIGMRRTTFKNASGLPDKSQVTTARDMITLANKLMSDHPEKYAYFKQKYFKYKGRKYRNHNRLLFDYKGTDGIKTGYIRASGFNLLANVHRGNKHLIAVVFGGKTSKSRNAAMRSILNKSLPRATTRHPRKHRSVVKKMAKKPVRLASLLKFPEDARVIAVQSAQTPPSLPVRKTAPETAASLPAQSQGNKTQRNKTPAPDGNFHIQVGAYSRQADAMDRLAAIQQTAGEVITGHAPLAMPLVEPKRNLYRARFAGFTRRTADSTCSQLKRRAITCVVMSAE